MKNTFRVLYFILVFLLVASCRKEGYELIEAPNEKNLEANSSIANLMLRTSMNDGSYDNIIDNANCYNVQLPITVTANGQEITISSVADYDQIETIFDTSNSDQDVLIIQYPITVRGIDYLETQVNSQEVLNALASACNGENVEDDDIECVDFVYPISASVYNKITELTSRAVITTDRELYGFIVGLNDNLIVNVEFPISLTLSDGTVTIINDLIDLESVVEAAKDDCDEDDDYDYNDDDFTELELDDLLVDCPLLVRQVIRNEVDNTEQYIERLLTFKEDGTVYFSTFTADEIVGTWSTSMSDNGVVLSLEFENFTDFSSEWYVYELEEGVIKLYKDGGNRIVLKRFCEDNSVDIDREVFVNLIQECEWVIKKVENQGEEIKRLLGYKFQFAAGGTVTLTNGINTQEGTWETGLNSQLQLSLMISIGDEPGVSFEWPIKDMLESRLRFEIEATDHKMVLLRVCDDSANDGDVTEIRSIAMDGTWNVALYKEGEMDMTSDYLGMDFNFAEMNQIEVSVNADPIASGLWRVLRDSEEGLKFYINFDTNDELAELTEDWKLVSITSTRIELYDESGDGTVETLVFEKP